MEGKSKRPTMAAVAREAGVSVMTVSNVVNGRDDLVKKETMDRVVKVITELGYRPHMNGRALRLSKSWMIGLIIVYNDVGFLASPWTSRLVSSLTDFLSRHNYSLLLHNCQSHQIEEMALRRFAGADALCMMAAGTDDERQTVVERLATLGLPMLALQEPAVAMAGEDYSVIRQDDRGGANLLARHVYEKGARKLVFLETSERWPAMRERIKGIEDLISEYPDLSIVSLPSEDDSYESVFMNVANYIAKNGIPDAFMAANEHIAFAVSGVLEQMKLSVPSDVLLTAFNAFDLWQYSKEKVTTIDMPAHEIGLAAGEALLDKLEGQGFRQKSLVLPTRILIGSSTQRERGKVAL